MKIGEQIQFNPDTKDLGVLTLLSEDHSSGSFIFHSSKLNLRIHLFDYEIDAFIMHGYIVGAKE